MQHAPLLCIVRRMAMATASTSECHLVVLSSVSVMFNCLSGESIKKRTEKRKINIYRKDPCSVRVE